MRSVVSVECCEITISTKYSFVSPTKFMGKHCSYVGEKAISNAKKSDKDQTHCIYIFVCSL